MDEPGEVVDASQLEGDPYQPRQMSPRSIAAHNLHGIDFDHPPRYLEEGRSTYDVPHPVGRRAIGERDDDRGIVGIKIVHRRGVLPTRTATNMVDDGEVTEAAGQRLHETVRHPSVEAGDPSW